MYYLKHIPPLCLFLLLNACGGSSSSSTDTNAIQITEPVTPVTPIPFEPTLLSPTINAITSTQNAMVQYDAVEWVVDISAEFTNPFNAQELDLSSLFTLPNGDTMKINGFWDGNNQWRIRLMPNIAGTWQYKLQLQDINGVSETVTGEFNVDASNAKGGIQLGSQFNNNYSSRYFVHQDGSPFYGVGHADAFSIFETINFLPETRRLINNMNEADENYVLWWPQFYFSLVETSFDTYALENLLLIDGVLEQMSQNDKLVVFTIWDHPQLRDNNHSWSDGKWFVTNGFNRLTTATAFFENDDAWQYQENLYRYMIARWGHSNALAMWHTVSEINGTNAFDNTNSWHQKINDYFVENDPYKHVTTASMSGDQIWFEGNEVMDVPQVHVYQDLLISLDSPIAKTIETANVMADYTLALWQAQNKPNWIGEFGVQNAEANHYPELFHNAIWSALAAGAAFTPAEWNDFATWGVMTTEMKAHMRFFSRFVKTTELAKWSPEILTVTSNNNDIQAWGLAGSEGGIVWVQDAELKGLEIDEIRAKITQSNNVSVDIQGLQAGEYQITPYDTWQGIFHESFTVTCSESLPCTILLPEFRYDIAFRINAVE